MHNVRKNLLTSCLVFSESAEEFSPTEWELLVWQGVASGVLSRLTFFWKHFNLFIPPHYALTSLVSAEKYWLSQKRIVHWELYNLQQVFSRLEIPLVLLKGTAYLAAELNSGLGRVFNDIDILVPKDRLFEVKEALKWSGWFPEKIDSYDQHYYEQWMHELPPLRHIQRGTSLDVHHNIVPQTCNLCPDAELLINSAVKISGTDFWVLSHEDMILHSATHLFWGGEFDNGLRDLSDLDLLLRQFSADDINFWSTLLNRAELLGLRLPLFFALRYTSKILKTPVPEPTLSESRIKSLSPFDIKCMDFLFLNALLPNHPTCRSIWTPITHWLLFVRSHWLKMPWYLLLPHLARKAWIRLIGKDTH